MKVRVDMKTLLKLIYRYFKSKQLRIRGVIVSPLAHFNRTSKFEGVNVVHRGAVVSGSEIGYGTYIGENSILGNCRIGKYCSIAGNVKVVASTHPTRNFVSTSPMFFSTLKQNGKTYCERNKFNEHLLVQGRSAVIGNDVWIGDDVTIKGGITIGDGAIVAMDSCVTKDIPPYAIVGGVPAKIIRYRFNEEEIKRLLSLKWWNKPEEWIIQHSNLFVKVDEFLKNIEDENSSCDNCGCL